MIGFRQEKRRYFRLKVDKIINCKLDGTTNKNLQLLSNVGFKAKVINVSPGGMCIGLDDEMIASAIKTGDNLNLELRHNDKNLFLPGRVAWLNPKEWGIIVGIKFAGESEEDHDALLEYLREELRKQ